MAERLCQQLLPTVQVFSRGLYANAAYNVPSKVSSFLSSKGIENVQHHSTQLSADDLKNADLIFCMEKIHLERLLDRYAQYTDKLYLLYDFAYDKEKDLIDPISLEGRSFIKQAEILCETVTAAVKKIKQQYGDKL